MAVKIKQSIKEREKRLKKLFAILKDKNNIYHEEMLNWFLGVLEGYATYDDKVYSVIVRILRDTIRLWR